jgi:hypothetical protein
MKTKIRLAVVGSRSFTDRGLLCETMKKILAKYDIEAIVTGGAKGADSLGANYAMENNIPLVVHKPDWGRYGKSAGFVRNHDIIKDCTHCVAFWDGESRGTKHDIELCKKLGKPFRVVRF